MFELQRSETDNETQVAALHFKLGMCKLVKTKVL